MGVLKFKIVILSPNCPPVNRFATSVETEDIAVEFKIICIETSREVASIILGWGIMSL